MIKAEVLLDSRAPFGARLTTFVLTYPRFIHAEFMTHRVFSRNASSSRAIPVSKYMEAIQNNPAMPLSFSKNCKGMQAQEDLASGDQVHASLIWLEARDAMMNFAAKLAALGVHKQHANRLLEPFTHITVVVSATEWDNFFDLRCHKDAQPEFQELATQMYVEHSVSTPDDLIENEWHLPFVTQREKNKVLAHELTHDDLIKMSVARCARVSYNTHDGTENSLEKDIELYNRLVGSSPIHASPTEHQAYPAIHGGITSGNFKGWIQYRKTLEKSLSRPVEP